MSLLVFGTQARSVAVGSIPTKSAYSVGDLILVDKDLTSGLEKSLAPCPKSKTLQSKVDLRTNVLFPHTNNGAQHPCVEWTMAQPRAHRQLHQKTFSRREDP